jgi:GTPase SAR1 family protein
MAEISRQLIGAIKEEIIRNVLKTHRRILVLGLADTGKTTNVLRALQSFQNSYAPCYFSTKASSIQFALSVFPTLTIQTILKASSQKTEIQQVLLIDDLDCLDTNDLETVSDLLHTKTAWDKIILLSRALIKSHDIMPHIDAVVKLKEKTAELIFSSLTIQKAD